ncbi:MULTISPECIES: hypothetical protein [Vibrio]|uniref:Uncharacterized protein n=1 Tax=Vibrio splendidus TaxID=29497 RepID=A0A2N7JXD0_VIBSP|nr:hypothetical protein [Vibrio splendidus]PMM64851.1 hypothetical protein BCT54_17305 [Vibrio splendidus]
MKKRINWKNVFVSLFFALVGGFTGWQLKTHTFQYCVSMYGPINEECVLEKANIWTPPSIGVVINDN